MQRCKCGTKLPIYVKNEKISSQKKYTKKLLSIHDLVVAEGRCHNRCKQNFILAPLQILKLLGNQRT